MEMGNECVMKRAHRPSSDIISDLPNSVIECILSHLPLQDVIKTSTLSTKWKNRWATLSHLVFNEDAFEGAFPLSEEPATMAKVAGILDQVLLQHIGPIIHFSLSIKYMKSCSDIDNWINFLSRHHVEEFTLKLWTGQPHKLFSRFCSLQQLRHLKLRNCVVKLPLSFNGFNRLTCIEFNRVTIAEDMLEFLISKCPLVKELKLFHLTGPDTMSIRALNLQRFYFVGNLNSICFKNTPCLDIVSLCCLRVPESAAHVSHSDSSKLVNVLGCLSETIHELELNCFSLKFLSMGIIPKNPQTTLHCLKVLTLYQVSFEDLGWVACALYLIRNSLNLEELDIYISASKNPSIDLEPALLFWKARENLCCRLDKLQRVLMKSISGSKPEMEFIRFILDSSPVLEKVIIEPNGQVPSYKSMRTLMDLARFFRASPRAEIIYLDEVEDN